MDLSCTALLKENPMGHCGIVKGGSLGGDISFRCGRASNPGFGPLQCNALRRQRPVLCLQYLEPYDERDGRRRRHTVGGDGGGGWGSGARTTRRGNSTLTAKL